MPSHMMGISSGFWPPASRRLPNAFQCCVPRAELMRWLHRARAAAEEVGKNVTMCWTSSGGRSAKEVDCLPGTKSGGCDAKVFKGHASRPSHFLRPMMQNLSLRD
jgi:hypothetical protein